MTQTMISLYEKEIENFCQKVTEPEFKQIQLHELFLNTTSGSDLINSMRKLILEKTDFFKTIQNRQTIPHIMKECLENVYEKLGFVIANHYSDKILFSKNRHSKESYERIMLFFVFQFKKHEVI